MTDTLRHVEPANWTSAVAVALADGFRHFDFLTAVDEAGRAGGFSVHARLVNADDPHLPAVRLSTEIPREPAELDSISFLIAGASWCERETTDFFGIAFRGGSDRHLLVPRTHGTFPLRKEEVLGARVVAHWPGAKEPGERAAGARRRLAPPGVPDPATWGDRDPALPPPTADDIAASTAPGRSRSRRPR